MESPEEELKREGHRELNSPQSQHQLLNHHSRQGTCLGKEKFKSESLPPLTHCPSFGEQIFGK